MRKDQHIIDEQNHIDWRVTEKLCREAVAKYKHKWSYKENIGTRILNEWECKVNECVRKRVASLKRKHITRRGPLLQSKRHSRSLEELHNKYVFVPTDMATDKAAENVRKEIGSTATYTYERIMEDGPEHCGIALPSQHSCFIGFPSFINSPMVQDSYLLRISALQSPCLDYIPAALTLGVHKCM